MVRQGSAPCRGSTSTVESPLSPLFLHRRGGKTGNDPYTGLFSPNMWTEGRGREGLSPPRSRSLRLFQSWVALGVWTLIPGAHTSLSASSLATNRAYSPCLGRGAKARLWLVFWILRLLFSCPQGWPLTGPRPLPQTAHWSKPKEENARQPASGPQSGLAASKAVFVSSPA